MDVAEWIGWRANRDPGDPGALGWAWATVDLERALAEAGVHEAASWEPVDDELLGARGLRLANTDPALILLEPSTEGRLAGWLARNGEGEAAVYRERNGRANGTPRMTALGFLGSIERDDSRPSIDRAIDVSLVRTEGR